MFQTTNTDFHPFSDMVIGLDPQVALCRQLPPAKQL